MIEFLPGSIYTTFLSTIAIEFPSLVFYMVMVDKVGRKLLVVWGFILGTLPSTSPLGVNRGVVFLGGVACMLIAVAPKWLTLICAVLCRFAVTGVFAVAYLYSSEIFPTVTPMPSVHRDLLMVDVVLGREECHHWICQ